MASLSASRSPDNDESSPGFRHVESVPTRYNPVTSIALLEFPSSAYAGGTHTRRARGVVAAACGPPTDLTAIDLARRR